ncbi:MAG: class I SAM-dependent methyltransferase [Pseudomonadota bacterium]
MAALHVVGSDPNVIECPWCGCTDRDRHLRLYLKALKLEARFSAANVLHFAPERSISKFIRSQSPSLYVTVDISDNRPVELRTNMENIAIASETVDIVIANHVLEHIENLDAGLAELHRVLKPGGLAILQTPYSDRLEDTFEDAGICDELARHHAYGQSDHVRLFGRNIFSIICAAGFASKVSEHDDALGDVNPDQWGVNAREPLMLFEKC